MTPSGAVDAEVLLRHGKWLAQLARTLVARDDAIDDVVQQTCVASSLSRPPFDTVESTSQIGLASRRPLILRVATRDPEGRAQKATNGECEADLGGRTAKGGEAVTGSTRAATFGAFAGDARMHSCCLPG